MVSTEHLLQSAVQNSFFPLIFYPNNLINVLAIIYRVLLKWIYSPLNDGRDILLHITTVYIVFANIIYYIGFSM